MHCFYTSYIFSDLKTSESKLNFEKKSKPSVANYFPMKVASSTGPVNHQVGNTDSPTSQALQNHFAKTIIMNVNDEHDCSGHLSFEIKQNYKSKRH